MSVGNYVHKTANTGDMVQLGINFGTFLNGVLSIQGLTNYSYASLNSSADPTDTYTTSNKVPA